MANEAAVRPSDANQITRRYLDSILVEERLIDSVPASLQWELFGETFETPIMTPAFSHLKKLAGRENGMVEYAEAAKNMGAVNWVGMIENEEFGQILATGAKTIRIIKPYADRDKVYDQIAYAENGGAIAVGMDIDHIFGNNGEYDVCMGEEMTGQTQADLAGYMKATKLPFIIKGVLSVQDARKCAELGVSGIVVSHHHGRLPYAIPPLMILPDIVKAVGGRMKIFVDCSIDTGADAYKALAMGADAVSVGRAMMPGLVADGAAGVEAQIRRMNEELRLMMGFTGCASLKDMDPSALWIDGRPFCAK